jgi:hypothetical protein
MFEHSASKLATREKFKSRVFKSLMISVGIFAFSLLIGIFGYHYIAGLGWTDAFMNASMILGGMGPVDILTTKASKLFAGFYALFSGVAFLSGMAVIVTPLLHRFLHKFHLETDDKEDQN